MARKSAKKKRSQKRPASKPAAKPSGKPSAKPTAAGTARKSQTRTRVVTLMIVAGITLLALTAIIVVTVLSTRTSSEPAPITGAADVASMLQGIPQQNNVLGNPNAPVTMIEFADLKCPVCAKFSTTTMPQLIDDYVRPGKLRIVFEFQTFVNSQKTPGDSERGARFALAAGEQNKLWDFAELHYKNQPPEDQQYFTDEYITSLGNEIAGLKVPQAFSKTDTDAVSKELSDYKQDFSASGFNSDPTFQVGKTGTKPTNIAAQSLDYSVFKTAIDNLL